MKNDKCKDTKKFIKTFKDLLTPFDVEEILLKKAADAFLVPSPKEGELFLKTTLHINNYNKTAKRILSDIFFERDGVVYAKKMGRKYEKSNKSTYFTLQINDNLLMVYALVYSDERSGAIIYENVEKIRAAALRIKMKARDLINPVNVRRLV